MSCYSPLIGYRSRFTNPSSGKRSIVFSLREALDDQIIKLPCGQCIGCRLKRSASWAIRCMHEASLYEKNCFITLTFNNEWLPKNGSLDVRDFQLFMKRLRKKYGEGIRFFHCGEYGERFKRPHYHGCLFNFDFADRELWSVRRGINLYTSKDLAELWPFGFSTVGDVTFESAAYVARYITKKITGERALEHYTDIDYETGEVLTERKPEYVTMSRRPGIGKGWIEKYMSDVYPDDFVLRNGSKLTPPKYYDSQFEIVDPFMMDDVKEKRVERAKRSAHNNTTERLLVREEIQLRKFELLKRGYERED